MKDIIRNMLQRKVRSGLTILGIVIGVFALTVMGAMAEKVNLLVSGGVKYYDSHTVVQEAGGGMEGAAPISTAMAAAVSRVAGVKAVVPIVTVPLKSGGGMSMGESDQIVGAPASLRTVEPFKLMAAQGTIPSGNERGVVAVGSSIAREYKLHVGDTLTMRGRPFTVKAILETTMTAPDNWAMVSLREAQEIYIAALPPLLRHSVRPAQVASVLNVYPVSGVSADTLAKRIRAGGIRDIQVMSPAEMKKQLQSYSAIFDLIITGSALIALIVGTLSVVNTMAMSVSERIREIGLRKAIGAKTNQVLREYLMESSVIGMTGGLVGLGLGWLLVTGINAASASSGNQVFEVTARLAIGAVLFATILGAIAGFFPALRAARLNPVDALRAE